MESYCNHPVPECAAIAAGLSARGFSISENFLNVEESAAMRAELEERFARNLFRPAGVGRAGARHEQIRRDEILWFEPESLSARLGSLRDELNRELFLNLRRFEGHYARYPAGGFYHAHLDNLSGKDTRVLSLVLYLNEAWRDGDGGELQLNLSSEKVKIPPRAGTLVCFLSREIEHQVLHCFVPRMSYVGWYHCSPGPSPL